MSTNLSDQPRVPTDSECRNSAAAEPICTNEQMTHKKVSDLNFSSKGLHFCNLNIYHLLTKLDELRVIMAFENSPDIFGACETFLDPNISDNQLAVDGYDFLRKDRASILNKSGGGVILYFRNTLTFTRRSELEISKIETIWAEVELPNAKPFLICTVYRPPNVRSEWIDLFEEELSIAQATGLEYIIMGDFNIDMRSCSNSKWLNLIQLFDLTQIITEPTRIMQTSATLIDHVYTNSPANIVECFVSPLSVSDYYPICFSRKINCKLSKHAHITTTYRSFKNFNEGRFLSDLTSDMQNYLPNQSHIDDDFDIWSSVIVSHINNHAPMKTKRVKSKRLPEWFTADITEMRNKRDTCKRLKMWTDYRKMRNKTKQLIRHAKRKYFSDKVDNAKDTKSIWKHLRGVNTGKITTANNLPTDLL